MRLFVGKDAAEHVSHLGQGYGDLVVAEDDLEGLGRFLKAAGGDPIEIARRIIEIAGDDNAEQVRLLRTRIENFADDLVAHRDEMRKDQEFLAQQVFSIVVGFHEEFQNFDRKISKIDRDLKVVKYLCFIIIMISLLGILSINLGDLWILFTDRIMQIEPGGPNIIEESLLG